MAARGAIALRVTDGLAGPVVAGVRARVARPNDAVLGWVDGLAGMHDIEDYPDADVLPGLVVYRWDSALFFANADEFRRRALATVDSYSDVHWFVFPTLPTAVDAYREATGDEC